MRNAGIGYEDVRELVRREGLEGALGQLYDAGVYVTLEEFKGRLPIRRGSFTLEVSASQFDNTLLARHFSLQSGGSTGKATPLMCNLAHYAQEAVYDLGFLASFDLLDRPYGIWRPPPPYHAGLWAVLDQAKLGRSTNRWFAQNPMSLRSGDWKEALFTYCAILESRVGDSPLPFPEYTPLDEAWRVAEWLAETKRVGKPALFNTNVACAVRVSMAARERDLDVSGTLFRVGGEPLTLAKARIITETGSSVVCHYGGAEAGRLGIACRNGAVLDDVHLLLDKIALIRRPPAEGGAEDLSANVVTTLLPSSPKLMLNVKNGDHGVLEQRRCGCLLDEMGYHLHLHTIRSHGRVSSEGMTILSADLVRLLEEVLPMRFGGQATDYQLVEAEDRETSLPRLDIIVSTRVGAIDESALKDTLLGALKFVDRWRAAGTLRIVRKEPIATSAGKVLPLHVLEKEPAPHRAR